MKVAITGAEGKVGKALIGQLDPDKFEITKIDLPDYDASIYSDILTATKGHDALIHLAWKDLRTDSVDPANSLMFVNAYRAAKANGIGKLIMGSSNHARAHTEREDDGKIRYTGRKETANNVYGEVKQQMEAMGRNYAYKYGLDVLCLRIGNVNEEDKPKSDVPSRWLSHRDLGRFVTLYLEQPSAKSNFEVVYGVSDQPTFDWVNSFGYVPIDSSK